MKTLYWKRIIAQEDVGKKVISLLEYSDDGKVRFWGSVIKNKDKYNIVAYSKDRILKTIEETIDSVKEAQEAIEKFLFDEGVLQEGDETDYLQKVAYL